jgi:hypothetical protein
VQTLTHRPHASHFSSFIIGMLPMLKSPHHTYVISKVKRCMRHFSH